MGAVINHLPTNSESETVLWTNSSPSASFSSQTISLSDVASKYKYLRIYYRFYVNIYDKMYTDFSIDRTVRGTYATRDNGGRFCLALYHWAGYEVCRTFYFTDYNYNQLVISNCTRIGGSATQNDSCVPLKVVGVR